MPEPRLVGALDGLIAMRLLHSDTGHHPASGNLAHVAIGHPDAHVPDVDTLAAFLVSLECEQHGSVLHRDPHGQSVAGPIRAAVEARRTLSAGRGSLVGAILGAARAVRSIAALVVVAASPPQLVAPRPLVGVGGHGELVRGR